MMLEPSADQQFFRETTARFLDEQVPVAELRRLRQDPAGFDEKYWRRGLDLGWTSLLVDEAHGGGSISGHGLVDLTLVAYEFGRHAAPGPLGAEADGLAAGLSCAAAMEATSAMQSARGRRWVMSCSKSRTEREL